MNIVQNNCLSSGLEQYAKEKQLGSDHPLYQSILAFESALTTSKSATIEEAVPGDMMGMFTDEQWPALLFEFQPSLHLFSSRYAIIHLHSEINKGHVPDVPNEEEMQQVLIFCDQRGQLMRPMMSLEHRGMALLREGKSFGVVAADLWQDEVVEQQHYKMTEQLLQWLEEGLIIDAGVPIPEDAEFEQEYEGETS